MTEGQVIEELRRDGFHGITDREKLIVHKVMELVSQAPGAFSPDRVQELEMLVEGYRDAVRKVRHITFIGAGCEVHTVAEYASLADGYLMGVEGIVRWRN